MRHVLAELAAARIITLAEAARAKAKAVRMRLLELLQQPELRNVEILSWFLRSGYAAMAKDLGGDAATRYYRKVTEYVNMPIEQLHAVAPNQRDSVWYDSESILLAAVKRQAFIERGGAIDGILMGLEHGRDRREALAGMSADDIRKVDYDVKGAITERAKS